MRKYESHNQALHQTPDTPAVLAGAGGGAGELVVKETLENRATEVVWVFWTGPIVNL